MQVRREEIANEGRPRNGFSRVARVIQRTAGNAG